MRTLGVIHGEGFVSEIIEDDDKRVFFKGDADIDADGANGQNGARAAYTIRNDGSELLANGGMGVRGGKVVGVTTWYDDIVILGLDGNPEVFPGGIIASKTSYRFPDKGPRDPSAYVDAETIPYIVVPPLIIRGTAGVVMGCKARATNTITGKSVDGIVADAGPRNKVGEVSIAMARLLGLNPSPRVGGEDRPIIKYELWPGIHGEIKGQKLALQRASGGYIFA